MNEKINLVEILKDCPKGTELYSAIHGKVHFDEVVTEDDPYPISVIGQDEILSFTVEGRSEYRYDGEIMLFPSKDQRDWSKFKPKKPKFDPKTLQPFDKVLVRDNSSCYWECDFFSRIDNSTSNHKFRTISSAYRFCIPYNDDTKHLVGKSDEAPEYCRYWEE